MSGVDFGIETPNEPINENTETCSNPDWWEAARFYFAQAAKKTPKYKPQRRYTVTRRKNGNSITEKNVAQNKATRIAREYRLQGFAVDLIEECSLTGEITYSPPSTDKIPCPTPYPTRMQKSRAIVASNKAASINALQISRQNVIRNAKKDQNKSLVYDKRSGALVYSGEVDGAVDFILNNMQAKEWVIYVPNKIWNKYLRTANG
jgi:hypothetical protein